LSARQKSVGAPETALQATDREDRLASMGLIDRLFSGVVAALLAAIFITLLSQVVMRYVFGSPLAWSEELARYLFVWLTFLGAGLAFRLGAHIAVDLLTDYLKQRVGMFSVQLLRLVIQMLVAVFLIAMLAGGVNLVRGTVGQVTPGLGISMAWVYLAIPVGSVIMLLTAVNRAVLVWRRKPGIDSAEGTH
jgi:TRAP-type C4-dicarboxylate transport system permease small subunit